ncbi:hypothetical protein LTR48_009304, partial [Friedmanniomyces endolithicus]
NRDGETGDGGGYHRVAAGRDHHRRYAQNSTARREQIRQRGHHGRRWRGDPAWADEDGDQRRDGRDTGRQSGSRWVGECRCSCYGL